MEQHVDDVRLVEMTRQAFLVLSMHRSGTSTLAGLLVRLGVEGPRTLMPPDSFNPLGYWESEPIAEYHDRLLRSAHTSWDAWTAVSSEWDASPVATVMGAELPALLTREFGTASAFVVKDPRMCRFVPFWLRILQSAGIDPVGILVFRNPADVASSLAERDGLLPQFSLLMWLRHMLDAERFTRMIPRAVVEYRDLLGDWRREVSRIGASTGVEWPCPLEVAADAVEQFVRPDLCHHAAGQAAIGLGQPLADWVTRTYDALGSLASGGTARRAEAFHALDDVRAQFEAASSLFGRADEERRRALLDRLQEADAERVDLRAHASALGADRERYRNLASAAEARTADLLERVVSFGREREHLQRRVGDLERHEADVHRLLDEAVSFGREREHLQRQVGDLERHAADLARELASARHRVAALLSSGSWRLTAPLRALVRATRRTATTAGRPPTP